ncbi:MAG TPA: DUF4412 domain-containing protein [Gemmatimonadaceae bacterium]
MRTYRTAIAMLGLSLAPYTSHAQKPFEGVINYEVYTSREPHSATVTVKGKRLRAENWDEQGKRGTGGTILINAKGEFIMATPERKVFMRPGGGELRLDSPTHAWTFTKTGRSETVLGNSCDYYTMHNTKASEPDSDLCIATTMGTISVIPSRTFPGIDGQSQFPNGFLVLKSVDKSGKVLAVATKIDRHSVSDDLFEVPSDWREIDLGRRGRL